MNAKLQKLASMGLAGMLALGMAMPALAADTTTAADITINGTGKSYEAYRLLDLSTGLKADHEDHEGTDHSNDCYSYNYTVKTGRASALKTALDLNETATDSDIITAIENLAANPDSVRNFADKLFKLLESETADETAQNKTFSSVPQGYYLIVETETDGENDSRSLVMLDTAGQVEIQITSKEDVPTLKKEIEETDNRNPDNNTWQDAGDFDIGDDVKFRLTGTLPENIANYEAYKYIFHDKLGAGLSFNADSVKVMAGNTELPADAYEIKSTDTTDGCSFELSINDIIGLLKAGTISKDSAIVVEYTAKLGEGANIGSEGNENEAHLEFTNDPYHTDNTGNTPKDKVVGFTFKLDVNKTDKEGNALKGAEFKLMKKGADGEYADFRTLDLSEETSEFQFAGLDSGEYKLVETKVPSGYQKADDIEFVVVATYETESDNPQLLTLQVKDIEGNVISGEAGDDTAKFQVAMSTGSMVTAVVNESGIRLPTTGGAGAYLIYGLGALAVIGGGGLYVYKKKKTAE